MIAVTSNAQSFSEIDNEDNSLLKALKAQIKDDTNFIHLSSFTTEQWKDVLSTGGGDINAANGALQLPEVWKKSDERAPIQAKVEISNKFNVYLC